ncbi:MAG: 30S ribosomal protein S20 [Myxococcota bacterium]
MANHASAKKRIRQTVKRTLRNKHIRSTVKTYVKQVRAAIDAGEVENAEAALKRASKMIDIAVSKGVYHRRTGSRYISRIATRVASLVRKSD